MSDAGLAAYLERPLSPAAPGVMEAMDAPIDPAGDSGRSR